MIVFDIETRPAPVERLKEIYPPFDRESFGPRPGEFDPSSVKTGNLKDQSKIDAKIEEARAKHDADRKSYDVRLQYAEANHWQELYDKAALSAETGSVCAIGYLNDRGIAAIHTDLLMAEEEIISAFWEKVRACYATRPLRNLIGFNSNRFDLPFLVRRSWYLGVDVPTGIFTPAGYVSPLFVDLLDKWQCGDRRSWVKLDTVCRACGIAGKPDDCTGAMFHQMLSAECGETREAAINYLKNDLAMTAELARRMGVL